MRRFIALVLCLSLVAVQVSSAQTSTETINLVTFLDTGNFNPLFSANTLIQRLTYDALYRVDGETGLPTPGLGLTSWDISEDGLTYTFTIRDDAYWSDGVPITTKDIEYTLEAASSSEVQSWYYGYLPQEMFTNLEIIDDKTFSVKLDAVNCSFISRLFWFVPVAEHIYGPDITGVNDHPANIGEGVSSGPYFVVEYSADEFVRFQANPFYRGGPPVVQNIIMRFQGDPAVTTLMLETGELDYLRMTASQFDQLTDPSQFDYYVVPNQFSAALMLNSADPDHPLPGYEDGQAVDQPPHPVLGDVRVRHAIQKGYNKDDILKSIREDGAGTPMTWLYHPELTSWANDPTLSPMIYDPEGAMALLEEAGWTDEDGDGIRECHDCLYAEELTPLAFEIAYAPIFSEYQNMVLVAQDQLRQIGFDVSVIQVEYNALLSNYLQTQTFDAAVLSFGVFPPDPDTTASYFLDGTNDIPGPLGTNYASVVDQHIDELLYAGRTVPGCAQEDRAPLYHEIQRIGLENAYFGDWAFTSYDYLVVNKRVKGFVNSPLGGEGSEYDFIQNWTLEE